MPVMMGGLVYGSYDERTSVCSYDGRTSVCSYDGRTSVWQL